ncbi:hypothetical protein C8J57DRAFT_1395268 [Mycena rebaudengoi]|nr:hypothetical protein C8J57DRAFT_1395268 [Mycena rebaudengoi]
MSAWILLAFLVACCTANLGSPASEAAVNVKAFNVVTVTIKLPGSQFQPVLPGYKTVQYPLHSFLVEHAMSKKRTRLIFDLGMRKDPLNLAPCIVPTFQSGTFSFDPFKDITELLTDGGVFLLKL